MSKFQNQEAYLPEPKEYKLLPFRFERLNQTEYVLSNFCGELACIKNQQLERIIDHKLSSNEPLYADLRAKHFIYEPQDKSPIELLALKYRTKLARLADFTSLHLFVVTLRCDHSCPYCQVSRQSEDKSAFDMTREMADKSLDFVFRSPSPVLKIEFQGGEPLLNFEMVRYIVIEAKKRNQIAERELEFVIATTLSLLTDEILVFCKEHQIILSTSLDGTENLHNTNRPRPGKNSHCLLYTSPRPLN